MAGMGFFIPKYQTYQMAVPSDLAVETVRMALFDYAKTEDDEGMPHPESLLTTMPYGEAIVLQTRLRAIDDFRDDAGLGSLHEA